MFDKARQIQRRHLTNGEGGFTLIELLIVIVVLGILAAIVVFALGGVTGQSAIAACNSDAKTVSIAVSAFEANNPGQYPTFTAATSSAPATSNLVTGDSSGTTYLKSWPSNPSYYLVSLDSTGDVMVALANADNGAQTIGTTSGGYAAPKQYDGSGAYTYAINTTLAYSGQGICQGA